MSRWKPKHTKEQVIDFFEKNPTLRSTHMAERLGCSPEYVRAVLTRNGLQLHNSSKKKRELLQRAEKKKIARRKKRV